MEQTPIELNCKAGAYEITVKLQGKKIVIRAFSDSLYKLYTGSFLTSEFPESSGGYEAVLGYIEQSIESKQKISFSDAGELKFPFQLKIGKREITKDISFPLAQVELNDQEKMNVKIQKLEKQVKILTEENHALKIFTGLETPKGIFQVDNTTAYFNKFNTANRQISLIIGNSNVYYPIFCRDRLANLQKFQFQITNNNNNYVIVGVSIADHRNATSLYNKAGVVCLYTQTVYNQNATKQACPWNIFENGGKFSMTVDLDKWTVQWCQEYPTITPTPKFVIPVAMRDKHLFAFIELYDSSNNSAAIKLL